MSDNGRDVVDRFDFIVIGAGPAGEAAAYKARELGASVAVVERDLFGGSCPHWGCVPSKTLLNGALRHAHGGDYPWARASDRRDYMINRIGLDYPDDSGHVKGLEAAGATAIRGSARIVGPGRIVVSATLPGGAADPAGAERTLQATDIVIAVGSSSKVPPVAGHRDHPHMDQSGRHLGPPAAAEPAGARRWADRRRACPGLRPVRGSGDRRPVGRPARSDRSPAQLGCGAPSPGARRRDRPSRGPGAGGAGRRGRRSVRTSSSWTMARPPPVTSRCWRSDGPFRSTASASSRSACRRESCHMTDACGSATDCG